MHLLSISQVFVKSQEDEESQLLAVVKKDFVLKSLTVFLIISVVSGGTNCGDGIIENSDALSVLQYATGKATPPSELVKLAADVDHDGDIDSDDALLIQQHAVGSATINQNVSVTNVPDDCYYTSSVAF